MLYEDSLRALARKHSGSPMAEVRMADKRYARQTRTMAKSLPALCKEHKGSRENMVVVITTTGSTWTNVEPIVGDPTRYTGLQYYPSAAGTVPSGIRGTFSVSRVKVFYPYPKTGTIKRR